MKLNRLVAFVAIFVFLLTAFKPLTSQSEKPAVIPIPVEMKMKQGEFILNSKTKIVSSDKKEIRQVAEYFKTWIEKPTGFKLKYGKEKTKSNAIVFRLVNNDSL